MASFSENLSDLFTINDTNFISKFLVKRMLLEGLSLSEVVARLINKLTTGDVVSIIEPISQILIGQFGKTLFGVSLFNVQTVITIPAMTKAIVRPILSTLSLVDTLSKSLVRALSDIFTLISSVSPAFSKNLLDYTFINETNVYTDGLFGDDTFGNDTFGSSYLPFTKLVNHNESSLITIGDTLRKTANRILIEVFSFSDVFFKATTKCLTDTYTLVSSIIKSIVDLLSDTLQLTDLVSTPGNFNVIDFIYLSDTITKSVIKKVTNTFSINETISTIFSISLALFESYLPTFVEFFTTNKGVTHILKFKDVLSIVSDFKATTNKLLVLFDRVHLLSSLIRRYIPNILPGLSSFDYGNLRFFTGFEVAPVVLISPTSVTGTRNTPITFSAAGSYDPNLAMLRYTWTTQIISGSNGGLFGGELFGSGLFGGNFLELAYMGDTATVTLLNSAGPAARSYSVTVTAQGYDANGNTVDGPDSATATITYPQIVVPTITNESQAGPRNSIVTITPTYTVSPYASPIIYSWSQISGTNVKIITPTNLSSITISTAGALVSGETLEFSFTVNDQFNTPVTGTYSVVVPARA